MAGSNSARADKLALREKMRAMGLEHRQIAAEFARRYRLRPRTAWREAYGWSLTEAARRINEHTGDIGLDPGGLSSMSASHLCEYEAWPGQASKETGRKPEGRRPTPYLLALLAAVYGCTVLELIDVADREHLPAGDLLVLDKYSQAQPVPEQRTPAALSHQPPQPQQVLALPARGNDLRALAELRSAGAGNLTPVLAAVAVPALSGITYRRIEMSDFGDAGIEQAVTMAAHEGSDHAEQAEERDIGDATLEQLRADVVRLSHEWMTGQPFPLFLEMRRVRQRIHAALDRRLWPRDQTELYFLLGCLNGLMAIAAKVLGYPYAAEELIRAGWAYATVIDHRPLMGRLRATSSDIAYWHGRPRQARDLAASGLNYLAVGPNAAMLHLQYAGAVVRLGDAEAARRAITSADEARERREYTDDLLEIGGEFSFSRATQHYYAGRAVVEVPHGGADAVRELEHAADLYRRGEPGEDHSHECQMLAQTELATAHLRAGQLDAAITALQPVMVLPSDNRTDLLSRRLTVVLTELARPEYHGSPQAPEQGERIEEFCRQSVVVELHDLPAG